MWEIVNLERTLAWARYLFWADIAIREFFDEYREVSLVEGTWQDWWHFFARLSHWYASEYVVIEGWRDADLHDHVIDDCLTRWSDMVNLLRRYRNGVFHYQPNLIEPRFEPILQQTEESMLWVRYLHTEFCRYYWTYVNDCPGTADERAEFRDVALTAVGWIPEDIVEARAAELRRAADSADNLTAGHTDTGAQEVRQAAENARTVAAQQVAHYRAMCRAFLARTAPPP